MHRARIVRYVGVLVGGLAILGAVRGLIARNAAHWASQPIHQRLELPSDGDLVNLSFIFQPGDCPTSTAVISDLNRLAADGVANVQGYLAIASTKTERRQLARQYDIEFALNELRATAVRRAMFQLGYRQTPIIIASGPNGEIRYVLEARAFGRLNDLLSRVPQAVGVP